MKNSVTPKPRESRKTVAARVQRHRAGVLHALWAPRGISPCGGAESCPWAPEGSPCACLPEKPCRCERELYGRLTTEGMAYFGGEVLSGLVARSLLEAARATLKDDPDASNRRLDLLKVLLPDRRKAEDLQQRERRLALEESRAKPKQPALAQYLAARAASTPLPAPGLHPSVVDAANANVVDSAPIHVIPGTSAEDPDSGEAHQDGEVCLSKHYSTQPESRQEASEQLPGAKGQAEAADAGNGQVGALPAAGPDTVSAPAAEVPAPVLEATAGKEYRWLRRPPLAPAPYLGGRPPELAIVGGDDGPRAAIERLGRPA